MKLAQFSATDVHDHINFNVRFNESVNFIAGLNGSGKTSALNIITALLAPSLEDLAKIRFKNAELSIKMDSGDLLNIRANQVDEWLELRVESSSAPADQVLRASIQELKHSVDRSSSSKFWQSEVFRYITKLPSPMYLSLDRRFIKEVTPYDASPFSINKFFNEKNSDNSSSDTGMKEALDLISKQSAEIKDRQTLADHKLRNKIILDSFFVDNSSSNGAAMALPNSKSLQQLKDKQRRIKTALISLDVKNEELSVMYDKFFDNLTAILINVLNFFEGENEIQQHPRGGSASKSSASERKKDRDLIPTERKVTPKARPLSLETSRVLGTWFSNSHQIARIDRLINLISEYEKVKADIYAPLQKFESLVNLFLKQTNKKISVNNRGEVKIFISDVERPLTVLSSGERQILIMLAHLSLNSHLPKSGVFIVDEPELSLHIAWQDMFLEAVQAAGPDLQIILATHSPAIIGGRRQYYIPLNGGI
ncbi:AAA family ATPase [Pseudomonas sp. NPDC090203]|uniref:AAA family ATPase n=1 Tax=Pseudomonas sp. NPDC090203 TaxID=3364477 RepID=UPI0037FADE80